MHTVIDKRDNIFESTFGRSSAEVFSSNVNGSDARVLFPCIFCKGDHYNDECDKYVTLMERKKRLSQQGRCFICLKVGHVIKNCPSAQKKPCSHCGRRAYHNRCLCPEKFPIQLTESLVGAGSSNPVSDSDCTDVTLTQSLLAFGEKVLLQTATVPIQTCDGKVTLTVRVLPVSVPL